ncbi:cAMP phosphodiesterases class-II-domain-containing protein [Aspergillus pseudodeflectus]|uniref:cAMP phosphodiesterases class-II-domain-containing protein n=1 Tax=Aspergillus pseudodeflectus TaxID=176178 RepID=A0ABR4K6N4_9EURO
MPRKTSTATTAAKAARRKNSGSFAAVNQPAESTASPSPATDAPGPSRRDDSAAPAGQVSEPDTSGSKGTNSSFEVPHSFIPQNRHGMHIIVLGAGGGPREDWVSSILVRSRTPGWSLNTMIAVDAGILLSSVIEILDTWNEVDEFTRFTTGPFTGLTREFQSTKANAVFIFRRLVRTVMVSHPHLDHISALAINSPVLGAHCNPKTVAALPSVVEALKAHVFNDVIFPNLSDEDDGAGLITYQRLTEGGSASMGRGDDRLYVQVAEDLLTRCFRVSHGTSKMGTDIREPILEEQSRSASRISETTVESSAFFIREKNTGVEIIVFGDVESDAISQAGHNKRVWQAAAPKVISGNLRAIFIECSYSDSTEDAYLFGHLCPRHLIAELGVLAELVTVLEDEAKDGKRKRRISRISQSLESPAPKSKRITPSGKSRGSSDTSESIPLIASRQSHASSTQDTNRDSSDMPLSGLQIYIIHVKDDMTDSPHPGETILRELRHLGQKAKLGCSFYIPKRGASIHFE